MLEASAARSMRQREPGRWELCGQCWSMIYGKRLSRELRVCPSCGHHFGIPVAERLDALLDPGWTPVGVEVTAEDPLGFTDLVAYPDRLRSARHRTGLQDAARCAVGAVEGHPLVVAAVDFDFMGGSLGGALGEIITTAGEIALRRHTPLLIVSASGGARMQEGLLALMQMAKTSQMLARLDEAGVLSISLITDPTFGGVAASFATSCDILLAEPGARLGFAGPRVIEQTIGESLPEGFQTAEFLFEHGLIDRVCSRHDQRPVLGRLLAACGGAAGQVADTDLGPDVVCTDSAEVRERVAWDAVQQARGITRPLALDYANLLLDGFVELHGSRLAGESGALIGGVGLLGGEPVILLGHQRGSNAPELVRRNFGMPQPDDYRKVQRLARLAAKLRIPVVTLIDTPGAYPGVSAEERGQAFAIAETLRVFAALPTPVVAVVIGEGGSGGALALGLADKVLICENAVYSVISPEGCAAILWKSAAAADQAAEQLRLTAGDALSLGVVDGIVPEPRGGSEQDPGRAADFLANALSRSLRDVHADGSRGLVQRRTARFRGFGADLVSHTFTETQE
ncbi:acetyl-CoA carboxylase carboxyl transferase subunit beta [Saccharopolyspora lacisalsi]|uniref:Multifunctional fusion protein n=1 Tax=Halosaccharopolyspora lacisalsi TaxID=1000566 RepID=A0A839DZE2_9PSEU|nr:acetyl-CoA carboxylase carboxyltransferase subunit alpha/beta [Halosaccharopolyspora lacisalsi]MBA8826220.1 acetyl-CoA carboxylase carboxyl transferase subunit beta [Halosaccharopolyspora lacisalsi]